MTTNSYQDIHDDGCIGSILASDSHRGGGGSHLQTFALMAFGYYKKSDASPTIKPGDHYLGGGSEVCITERE